MKIFSVSFFITLLLSCREGGKDILPINKMKVVFLHHIMAEEMINNHFANRDTILRIDSLQIVSFDNVLKFNTTDSVTFYKSLAYYKSDIKLFKLLLDSTHAYADQLRQALYLKNDKANEEIDPSADTINTKELEEISNDANVVDSLVK